MFHVEQFDRFKAQRAQKCSTWNIQKTARNRLRAVEPCLVNPRAEKEDPLIRTWDRFRNRPLNCLQPSLIQ